MRGRERIQGLEQAGHLESHRGAAGRRALIALGFRAGQWTSFLAPALGLLVFWLFAFKPAVTLYVAIVGLAVVLLKAVELNRLSFEIEEVVRRYRDGNDAD